MMEEPFKGRSARAQEATAGIDGAEDEQRGTEPHGPGFRQPLAVVKMRQPLIPESAAAPCAREEVLGERAQDEHVEQCGYSQPDDPVAQEERETLSIVASGREVAREKEQQRHEEGLEQALIGGEDERRAEANGMGFLVVPVAKGAVGIRRMHA